MADSPDFDYEAEDLLTGITTGGLGFLIPSVAEGAYGFFQDVVGYVEDGADVVLDSIPLIGTKITGDNPVTTNSNGETVPLDSSNYTSSVWFYLIGVIVVLFLLDYLVKEVLP